MTIIEKAWKEYTNLVVTKPWWFMFGMCMGYIITLLITMLLILIERSL